MTLVKKVFWAIIAAGVCVVSTARGELVVPASTAYIHPDPNGARVSGRSGVTRWRNPDMQVLWFGHLKQPGEVRAKVRLRLPDKAESKLRLTVDGASHEANAVGSGTVATADFGAFTVVKTGYKRFTLESLNAPGQPPGDIEALILDGPALEGAHFNLNSRRNAASVHLIFPTPRDAKIAWFYNEVTAVEDPVCTFYMACGFHRGYFGMQVNSVTERRIIFSVWDSGNESVDRSKVAEEDRVQLVAKGEGVYASGFGNEGTGGHSHLKYMWKTGEPQRFLLGAKPVDDAHTVYAGYWFHPENREWTLVSAMSAPKDGGWLRRLHGFSENFSGSTGHIRRKALYGNQWMRTADGTWRELTTATFSHDPTGRADRLDRFMGVEGGRFFLSHGGFVPGFTKYGERFTRPATGELPAGIVLPEIPTPNALR